MGRAREIGALRVALDRTEASVTFVTGVRGVGKTSIALHAVQGLPHVYHRVLPLPEAHQWAALERSVKQATAALERAPVPPPPGRVLSRYAPPPSPWERIFGSVVDLASPASPPLVLVLDDAQHLARSRARWDVALAAAISRAKEASRPFHVVAVGGPGFEGTSSPGSDARRIHVSPLSYRAAMPWMPGPSASDKLRAYSVLGGIPGHLVHVDPSASLPTNIRHLFLDRDAPLANLGIDVLERHVQALPRYAAILSTLAGGDADWKHIHQGIPDLTASGQVAPYLRKLNELGWVSVHRSLDAAPGSRSRRYRVTDPTLAFWYRMILPYRTEQALVAPQEFFLRRIRPGLNAHAAGTFPEICRQYMRGGAAEALGSWARECGGLWAPDYDIPVAGVLRSGVPFYGSAVWSDQPLEVDALTRLDDAVGFTRFGFGRELRLKVLFSRAGYTPALTREAARRHDVRLLRPDDLVGEQG